MDINITEQQRDELINLIQELRIADFFEKAKEFGIGTYELNSFAKEFILGKQSFDYYDRLVTYVSSLVRKKVVNLGGDLPKSYYLDKLSEFAKKRADEIYKRIDALFAKQLECEDLMIQAFTPLQKEALMAEIGKIKAQIEYFEKEYLAILKKV
jgi:hypothetical protein